MRRPLMILTVVTSLAAGQAAAYDLSEHQWRHRLLFPVAPDGDDPDLAAQQRSVELRRNPVLNRDMRVFRLLREQGFNEDAELPHGTVTSLRKQLGVTPEDRLRILMGKDGGIRRRAELKVVLAEGVVDLGQDGAQGSVSMVAIPEAEGIESISQDPRKAKQPDPAPCDVDAFAAQHTLDPWPQGRAVPRTMVAFEKTQQIETVEREEPRARLR